MVNKKPNTAATGGGSGWAQCRGYSSCVAVCLADVEPLLLPSPPQLGFFHRKRGSLSSWLHTCVCRFLPLSTLSFFPYTCLRFSPPLSFPRAIVELVSKILTIFYRTPLFTLTRKVLSFLWSSRYQWGRLWILSSFRMTHHSWGYFILFYFFSYIYI